MQSAKVLIVDDEADVIQALKLRLETAGFVALTACDGAEALRLLQDVEPDLILADLMMPHLDGLELTRRVRQNPRWPQVRVLLLSSNDDPVARDLALEFGALDYLSKAVGARAIVARVRDVLAEAGRAVKSAGHELDYQEAERDLIAQLQAISPTSAGTLAGGEEEGQAMPESSAGEAASDLSNLATALGRTALAGRGHSVEPET